MAIGKRTKRQGELWIPTQELPTPFSHPFSSKVNQILASMDLMPLSKEWF